MNVKKLVTIYESNDGGKTYSSRQTYIQNEMATNCSQHHISNIDYLEKTLKYWKDEKEFAIVGSFYYGNCCARIGILEDILKSIQPIQKLPQQEISDEQIEKAAIENRINYMQKYIAERAFREGAEWYREQLKQRQ